MPPVLMPRFLSDTHTDALLTRRHREKAGLLSPRPEASARHASYYRWPLSAAKLEMLATESITLIKRRDTAARRRRRARRDDDDTRPARCARRACPAISRAV